MFQRKKQLKAMMILLPAARMAAGSQKRLDVQYWSIIEVFCGNHNDSLLQLTVTTISKVQFLKVPHGAVLRKLEEVRPLISL